MEKILKANVPLLTLTGKVSCVKDDISALAVHKSLGFSSADLIIGCRTAIRASNTSKRQRKSEKHEQKSLISFQHIS